MSIAFLPHTPSPARRTRSRLALVGLGLFAVVTNVGFALNAQTAARAMEARVLAGNFAHMSLEKGPAEITIDGRVYGQGATGPDPSSYVASTNLVPAGTYQTLIIADDGVAEHKAKALLVIGARDARGAWHPASAATLAAKLH